MDSLLRNVNKHSLLYVSLLVLILFFFFLFFLLFFPPPACDKYSFNLVSRVTSSAPCWGYGWTDICISIPGQTQPPTLGLPAERRHLWKLLKFQFSLSYTHRHRHTDKHSCCPCHSWSQIQQWKQIKVRLIIFFSGTLDLWTVKSLVLKETLQRSAAESKSTGKNNMMGHQTNGPQNCLFSAYTGCTETQTVHREHIWENGFSNLQTFWSQVSI